WEDIASTEQVVTGKRWNKIEVKFKMPDYQAIKVKLRWNGEGTAYFDDVCLAGPKKEAPAPMPSDKIRETYPGYDEDIKNGGFELKNADGTGPADWQVYKSSWVNNDFVEYTNEDAYSGDYSIKISANGAGSPWVRQVISGLLPGAKYQLSAWVNASNIGGKGLAFKLEFYSGDKIDGGSGLGVDRTENLESTFGRWVQQQITFTAPEGAGCVAIYARLVGTGTVYYDEISCRVVENAPTHFLETNEIFYYSDLDKGIATVRGNMAVYSDIQSAKVNYVLKDGEVVLSEKNGVSLESGEAQWLFDLSLLKEKKKEYTITATTVAADGTILCTQSAPVYKYDRPKALTKDGEYLIDGEPFHPIFAYHVDPSQFTVVKEAGINVVQTQVKNSTPELIMDSLDEIYKSGLRALVALYRGNQSAGHSSNAENTKKVIAMIKDHPAVFAYAVQDEPFLHSANPEDLLNSYKIIREIDDVHPVYMVEAFSDTYHLGGKYTDILTTDPYPSASHVATEFVRSEVNVANDLYGARKPIYVIQQAFTYKGYTPTVDALRNMIYQGYFAGGDGLGYYAMDEKINGIPLEKTDLWEAMSEWYENESADAYAHFVQHKYPVFSEHEDAQVVWSAYVKDNDIYAIVLNRNQHEETAFSMPLVSDNGKVRISDFHAAIYAGGDTADISGKETLTATLKPAQAVVFKITPQTPVDTSLLTLSAYTDLEGYSWAESQILGLEKKGITNMPVLSEYQPGKAITRADFAMFFVRSLDLWTRTRSSFADVSEDAYYAKELGIGKTLGILKGIGDGLYNPEAEISRQDLMTIIARGLNLSAEGADLSAFSDSESISDYALESVKAMVASGLVQGNADGTLNPQGKTTRAEAAVIMDRIISRQ
ncbi:MAG: S-layer homology domain-containing protein, partial [Clostridia bacterium]|nr:S-layer homology domain-containing protein [Clostridia bacterium]